MSYDVTARRLKEWTITKIVAVAVAFLVGMLISYSLEKQIRDNWILPDDVVIKGVLKPDLSFGNLSVREAYKSLNTVLANVSKNKYPAKLRRRIISIAKEQKKFIEKLYPIPTLSAVVNKNLYPESRQKAVVAYVLGAGISLLPVFFLWYWDRKKLRGFFYQVGRPEPPIKKGKPFEFINWEMMGISQEFFSQNVDPKWYNDLMAVYDHQVICDVRMSGSEEEEYGLRDKGKVVFNVSAVNEKIKEITDSLVKDGRREGLITDDNEEKFRFCCVLALFHYTAGFFGNVPSEMIAIVVKDPTVKAFISSYYYGKVFTLTSGGVYKKHLREVADFQTVFHGYRKEKEDFLLKLKERFCQIPLDTGFSM